MSISRSFAHDSVSLTSGIPSRMSITHNFAHGVEPLASGMASKTFWRFFLQTWTRNVCLSPGRQQRPYNSGAPYTDFGELKPGLWRPKFGSCQLLPVNWTIFFEIYTKNTIIRAIVSVLNRSHSKVSNSNFYYCDSLSGAKIKFFKMQIFFYFPLKCPKLISRYSSVTFKLSIH